MLTFEDWFKKNFKDETIPQGNIPAEWFEKHGIPMVVRCTCCGMTMCVMSAYIDEDDQTFCGGCADAE